MAFNSTVSADNWLNFTIGAAAALGNDDYTIATLFRPSVGNNSCGIASLRNGTSDVRAFLEDANKLFGENEFTGFGTLVQGTWYLAIIKALSASTYAFDLWTYADDGSGSMSHGNGAFSASAGSLCDNMRLGWGLVRGNGDFAVIGLWNRKIANAEAETLKSKLLSTWADLAPVELISFENWDGTVGSEETKIGSSACTTIQGSCAAATNPPNFDFSTAPSAIDLVVADASQTQTVDSLTLTQTHVLTVADAAQAQAADNLALSQVHQLLTADAAQAQAVDNVTLQITHILSVADAVQSQMADNVSLTQLHQLGIQSAHQAQRADTIGSLIPQTGTVGGAVTAVLDLDGAVTTQSTALAGIIE